MQSGSSGVDQTELLKWNTNSDDVRWIAYLANRKVMIEQNQAAALNSEDNLHYQYQLALLEEKKNRIKRYIGELLAKTIKQAEQKNEGELKAGDLKEFEKDINVLTDLSSKLDSYLDKIKDAKNVSVYDRANALRSYHRFLMSEPADRPKCLEDFRTASTNLYAVGGDEILWNVGKILAGVTLVALGFGAVYAGVSILHSLLNAPVQHTPASVGGISEVLDVGIGLLTLAGSTFGGGLAIGGLLSIVKGSALAWSGGSFFYNARQNKTKPDEHINVVNDAIRSLQPVVRPGK